MQQTNRKQLLKQLHDNYTKIITLLSLIIINVIIIIIIIIIIIR